MTKVLVTGGAGFIGSHLCEKLAARGFEVLIFDNLSMGSEENVADLLKSGAAKLVKGDIRSFDKLYEAVRGCKAVFHFAANPEVRIGDPETHFQHNLYGTYVVLEAMRKADVKDVVFASSSTVYGDAKVLPTPEDYGPLKPISVYGASKLGCEALISSYVHTYGFKGVALRYANVVGPRSKRGVIKDFIAKLLKDPHRLEILGDGKQTKSYIWIEDAVNATLTAWKKTQSGFEAYNVGSEDAISVTEIAEIVVSVMELKDVEFHYTGGVMGGRGWVGDVKYMHLKIDKLKRLGWKPKYNSREAVRLAAKVILKDLTKKIT